MELKRMVSLLLSAGMFCASAVTPMAEDADDEQGKYVLMNIPYDKFYEGEGFEGVDIITGATLKSYNLNMAAGSYHEGYDAVEDMAEAKILGVTYPVYVEDPSILKDFTEVKDEDTAEIDVAQGKTGIAKTEVSGKDKLFASGDYAYYVLTDEPTNYKSVSLEGEEVSFSAVKNGAAEAEGLEVKAVYTDHHVDVVLQLTDPANLTDDISVTGVIVETEDGSSYVLQHVTGIWRKTQIGWSWDGMDGNGLAGRKITGITYYLNNGNDYKAIHYAADIVIKNQSNAVIAVFDDEKTIMI